MYNSKNPSESELPTGAQLLKSTLIAAVIACVILITVVLPAEYAIDPTGIGAALGLKKMGEIKKSLETEAKLEETKNITANAPAVDPVASAATATNIPATSLESKGGTKIDKASLTLEPNQGAEIKAVMKKGAKVQYKWITDGGRANFDMHADSKKQNIKYYNYEKGSEQSKQGTLVAAFDGHHGWFWRNRTAKPLTVSLEISGDFEELKRME